jgi:4-amino-4-deoxy-L-arabinose transferase-like glycosyltransferase
MVPAACWAGLFFLFPPSQQDFPLNDDCLYSRTAFGFARGEGLNYYNQASMPLLGLLLWATPFLWLLGQSHVTLRLATMVLGVLGILGFYDLLRQSKGYSARQAGLAAVCLGLNPLYFLLSCQFHSDVPALAFSLLSLTCYQRGLKGGSLGWWLGGTTLALLAVVTRQNGVVVPVVAGAMLFRQAGLRWRPSWVLGVLLPLATALAIDYWLNQRADVAAFPVRFSSLLFAPLVVFAALQYVGLSAVPLLLLPGPYSRRSFLVSLGILGALAALLAFLPDHTIQQYHRIRSLFPYWGNLFTPWGQFEENTTIPGSRPVVLDRSTCLVLTLAGCLAGAGLVSRLAARWRPGLWPGPFPLFTLLHLLLLFLVPIPFDRYLLVLIPGGLALAVGELGTSRSRVAIVLVCLIGLLSFASVHDFLSWNRALWDLGRRAVAQGADPTDIEGGFTWNGWHSPHAAKEKIPREPRGLALSFTREQFPHVTARLAISFSLKSFALDTLGSEPYTLWLSPGPNEMLLVGPIGAKCKP